jgi:hypothetical protein
MTDEGRAARQAYMREYSKLRHANETDEQREQRLAREARRMREVRANETDEQRQERCARERQRYAERPEIYAETQRRFRRQPHIRERLKAKDRQRRWGSDRLQSHHEKLSVLRVTTLSIRVFSESWRMKAWTWKTHKPVSYDDRVDHRCTACDKIRFLKHWWKGKPLPDATDVKSNQDRYMCNHCFATDWDLIVPEKHTGKLPGIFTSPDHPPPFGRMLPEMAKVSGDEVKGEHEADHKEGRT